MNIWVFLIIIVGCILKFLPPYSPDMNPIEESFSAGKSNPLALDGR